MDVDAHAAKVHIGVTYVGDNDFSAGKDRFRGLDELGVLVPGAEVIVEHEEAVEESLCRWNGATLLGVFTQLRNKGLDPEAGIANGQLVGGLGQLDEDEPWEVAAVPVQSMSTRLSGRC